MSFLFLLLYIGAIYIRPQEWVPAIYGWPLIDILAVATAVCVFFEAGMRGKAYLKEPPNIMMLGFFGCILMSHLSHTYFAGMTTAFSKFLPNVIMFFLIVNVLVTEKRIKIAIWWMIGLTLFIALSGIHQFHNGTGFIGEPIMMYRENGEWIKRVKWIGIFDDPNDTGLAFVVASGFLVSFIFGKTKFPVKIISAGIFAVLMKALYYTNSRGAYLAMAAAMGIYFLMKMKNKILAIAIGCIIALIIISVGPSRMSNINSEESSAEGRIEAWYQGFQMLKSAPLFGKGYRMWIDNYSLTAHNSYILVAAEEGLIGLYFWIGLIYTAILGVFKTIKIRPGMSEYAYGTMAGLFGFLAASYFLSRSYLTLLYVILALGVSFGFTYLSSKDIALRRDDYKNIGFATVEILMMVWLSMRVSLRLVG